ncbi:MAG: putative adenosine/adenine deaminase [Herbinix sp.]|jgi:adenosine deaminase|nr:putative adenosine/adenine deaminase [Herbinix sp.]
MTDQYTGDFIKALEEGNLDAIRRIPKSDLHNHFSIGGDRDYIRERTGIEIESCSEVLHSMEEMHAWNHRNLGERFSNLEMRKLMIEATFHQAKKDGVTLLEIGEDVWGIGEFFHNDIDELIAAFYEARERIAPKTELRLQIGLSRHCGIDYLLGCLEHFWGRKEFYSIDLYGDELAQPIENFIPIYQKAKEQGLRLKAHLGEWTDAYEVRKGIELLQLDEVQHGIAAATSKEVMDYLVKNKIRLNITPTSNLILNRVSSLMEHPIRTLYHAGVDVTVNSDDILIFDSDVSKEYIRLYEAKTLTTEELDDIRVNGLKRDII